jgi:NADH dehydrogenase/NADH:ubiquinone oxidoreductase subunit G
MNLGDLQDGVKAVITFGDFDDEVHDILGDKEFEFICACSARVNLLTERADAVLPYISLIEKSGTFTGSDGAALVLTAAVIPDPQRTAAGIIHTLSKIYL